MYPYRLLQPLKERAVEHFHLDYDTQCSASVWCFNED